MLFRQTKPFRPTLPAMWFVRLRYAELILNGYAYHKRKRWHKENNWYAPGPFRFEQIFPRIIAGSINDVSEIL